MARIGLNMMFVAPGVAGGRVYCEGLLKGLREVDGDNEYVIYTRQGVRLPALEKERFRHVEAPVEPNSTLWRTYWEYRRLPRAVRRDGCQLFHGLGSLSPSSRSCPFVLTIHDLIYRHFPSTVPLGYRLFMEWVQPTVARRADRVIVPSRWTARDVVQLLGVKEERIRIVPYGPGNEFRPVRDQTRIDAAMAKYKLRKPYIISVCRGYVHKNVAGLLRAYAVLRTRGRPDVQLVLVGEKYRTGATLDRLTDELGVRDGVVLTGFASHEDLNALYSGASVFAFPSLAEGFGLPILEAMACGVPVVASEASAVAEAVADAGVLVDTRDPELFAGAISSVLEDAALAGTLSSRGMKRVQQFTWSGCARDTSGVYQELE